MQETPTPENANALAGGAIWLLVAVGLAYAGYFVLRYGGLWSENDTGVFSRATAQMQHAGTVLFSGQYNHGFGYTDWLGTMSALTGISVPVLNTVVAPFVGVVLLLVTAFLAYRTLLGSARWALLACLLLLPTSDLLFSALRGNHEKLNIALMLASIYVLFKGFEVLGGGKWTKFALWVLLFYVLVFADAVVNDYFASTFVFAAALTLGAVYWLVRRRPALRFAHPAVLRFGTTVAVSWLLICWVIFFVFTPAGQDFLLVGGTGDKLRSLFLSLHTSSNPFAAAGQQWASAGVNLVVAGFRWLLFGGSFVVWAVYGWRAVTGRFNPDTRALFLLALYGAFGVLIAISIPIDFSGLEAGSNLELRNFTEFALLAAPLMVWGAGRMYAGRPYQIPLDEGVRTYAGGPYRGLAHGVVKRWMTWLVAPVLTVFVFLGMLKSTLDPSVSNQWLFYTPAERQTLGYFLQHSRYTAAWTGPDIRLLNVVTNWYTTTPNHDAPLAGTLSPAERILLISPQVVDDTVAQRLPLPPYAAQDRVYDSGGAQLYRMAPETPFQN